MLLLAASFFFANPEPLDMPQASAFLVKEANRSRLEDRYDRMDLWTSRAVLGRWSDDDGRGFMLAKLDVVPPAVDEHSVETRVRYTEGCVPLKKKDAVRRRAAVALLSPVALADSPQPPRQMPRGMKNVEYWQGTNMSAIVCAFLPEASEVWYLATWVLAKEDDFAERASAFEWKFLEGEWKTRPPWRGGEEIPPTEREQLRADAHHSVTNYEAWHWTDAATFTVLDDLPRTSSFVAAMTNELQRMYPAYAAAVPSPLDGSNVLCVARIYRDREEYLGAVDEDMAWTAAYWSPGRRELVAYLPEAGADRLLRTIRHEALHQYLSYACSMIPASPWLNEGYAEYFEDVSSLDWELGIIMTPGEIERLSALLPDVMKMDYKAFYEGTNDERRTKYRIAWSIAVFLEKGAPEVRFKPFARLKADYVEALLKTHDMLEATRAALLDDEDKTKLFVREWVKFWKKM